MPQRSPELERVLAQPETRARHAFQFYFAGNDSKMNEKALNRFQEFLDVIELTESMSAQMDMETDGSHSVKRDMSKSIMNLHLLVVHRLLLF